MISEPFDSTERRKRHRWQETGTAEVPWSAAPITVRTCRDCGCVKTREPHGAHFRPLYELAGQLSNEAPPCPGASS